MVVQDSGWKSHLEHDTGRRFGALSSDLLCLCRNCPQTPGAGSQICEPPQFCTPNQLIKPSFETTEREC